MDDRTNYPLQLVAVETFQEMEDLMAALDSQGLSGELWEDEGIPMISMKGRDALHRHFDTTPEGAAERTAAYLMGVQAQKQATDDAVLLAGSHMTDEAFQAYLDELLDEGVYTEEELDELLTEEEDEDWQDDDEEDQGDARA